MFNMLEKVNRITKLWNGKNLTISFSFRNNTNHYAETNYNISSSCLNKLYLEKDDKVLASYQGQQYSANVSGSANFLQQFLYVDNLGVQVLDLLLVDYSYMCLNGTKDILCPSTNEYRRVQNEYNEGFNYR
jgi:hypothetical protein